MWTAKDGYCVHKRLLWPLSRDTLINFESLVLHYLHVNLGNETITEAVAFLTCIWVVPFSNLWKAIDSSKVYVFLKSYQTCVGRVSVNGRYSLSAKFVSCQYSQIILAVDLTYTISRNHAVVKQAIINKIT